MSHRFHRPVYEGSIPSAATIKTRGQEVKAPPSRGDNPGSISGRVTKFADIAQWRSRSLLSPTVSAKSAKSHMAPWSSGYDAALSRRRS